MRIEVFPSCPSGTLYDARAFRAFAGEDLVEYMVPKDWTVSACDVLIAEVFFKEALPALTRRVPEDGVPEWLWRSEVDESGLDTISAEWRFRFERDAREVFDRIAGALCYHGWKEGSFDSEEDARRFYDNLRWMMLNQIAMLEKSLMASCGLDWAYGVRRGQPISPRQAIAGFSLEASSGGLYVPVVSPHKNISGKLELLDRLRSIDGVTSPMAVVLPVENAGSADFISRRRRAEVERHARDTGMKVIRRAVQRIIDACDRASVFGFDPARNDRLSQSLAAARAAGVDDDILFMAIDYARQGFEDIDWGNVSAATEDDDAIETTSPPITTVVSLPDAFVESALTSHGFLQYEGGEPLRHAAADKVWDELAQSVWMSGKPEIFFRNRAALLFDAAGGGAGRSATGGFIFLPDTAAPSASLNLRRFLAAGAILDAALLENAVGVLTVALDAAHAAMRTGDRSGAYRPVMIGMTNVAETLMSSGIAYDSPQGRAVGAVASAAVTAAAMLASSRLAAAKGAFEGYALFEKNIMQDMRDKIAVLAGSSFAARDMGPRYTAVAAHQCPDKKFLADVVALFDRAYAALRDTGLRNAHVTGVDAENAVQMLLSVETRDISPAVNLVRFDAHGGDDAVLYAKNLTPAVRSALSRLGYNAQQIDDIYFHVTGHGTLLDAPAIHHAALRARGFHQAALDAVETALATAQHIRYAFNKWTLGADFCVHMLGFNEDELESGTFDMLSALGFSEDEIEDANLYCCGTLTLEGAPHLLPQHIPVFDCAVPVGEFSVRRLSAEAQLHMQAAVEAFVSGGVAHIVELASGVDIGDVQKLILRGWELGLRNLMLYRHATIYVGQQEWAEDSALTNDPLLISAKSAA